MSDAEFHLASTGAPVYLQCIEFGHPDFTQVYRVVTNAADGFTVKHEDGFDYFYEYLPLAIQLGNSLNDLDQTINITLGDLGEILPQEIDRIRITGSTIKPYLNYRTYRHDRPNTPLEVVKGLEIGGMSRDEQAVTFEAHAPLLNSNRTGLVYDFETYPMLRGFL